MRATTRLTSGLAALTAGLALTACGTATTAEPDATTPPCRTASLTWTLSLLDGGGTKKGAGRPDARLTAVNEAPGACVFAGYPVLEIHNGKAESIEGTGQGRPDTLTLPGKGSVTVDLHYTRRGTKGAGTWCVRQGEASVRAPHDTRGAVVPVTDAHGKAATIDACGETLTMAVPHRTPAGS
ncbi:DUF4232 domain-containing protein [Streptomyces flaveolus]|uniref:DUF4232 domain-containing protein n=1 Tax=Streptomyces flaveolus TaxID=67297 RepID=UPI0033A52864